MCQAEVRKSRDLNGLTAAKKMQGTDVSIAEEIEAEYGTLKNEQVCVSEPLATKEDLRRVNITVSRHSEEQNKHSDVHSIVGRRVVMVHDQKLALCIVIDSLEVHGGLTIRCLIFSLLLATCTVF